MYAKIKSCFPWFRAGPNIDEVEISVFGLKTKLLRRINLAVPHEVSVFIPRLEFNHKITEENRTSEVSIILSSLTIVSAPRHEPETGEIRKIKIPIDDTIYKVIASRKTSP